MGVYCVSVEQFRVGWVRLAHMGERPSAGIGKRIAKYRRIAGLSARELSEKLGG
jgi:hypothetical protein